MEQQKISFCTVCMNRLHHLQKTLPRNIQDNQDYQNLEFVILDYNSRDGLEDYIRNNFTDAIKQGRLSYYKTNTPKYFHRSHSRNLLLRLASGKIVCNVDADNYIGQNFSFFVNEAFSRQERVFLASGLGDSNVLGRICLAKKDFYEVSGYDESMSDYGFEDLDLINRLQLNGLYKKPITETNFLQSISHNDGERVANESASNSLSAILVRYINFYSSELVLLFGNGHFEKGTIVHNEALNAADVFNEFRPEPAKYRFSLKENGWLNGKWRAEQDDIIFKSPEEPSMERGIKHGNYYLMQKDKRFYLIENNPAMNEEAIFFYSQLKNRSKMELNKTNRQIRVNASFGEDIVFKNFDYKTPILINATIQ